MPAAAGAQPLGEGALRDQLDLQLAGQVLAGELLVLADVGAGDPGDAAGGEQDAEAPSPSTPQLLETTPSPPTPRSYSAWISTFGTPLRPKPPTASDAPSGTSATASAAEATTLSILRHLFVRLVN